MTQPPGPMKPRRSRADDGWGEKTIVGVAPGRPVPAGRPVAPGRPAARGSAAASAARVSAKARVPRVSPVDGGPKGRPHRVPFAVLILGVIAGGMCALLALNTATAASEVRERKLDSANAGLNATEEQLSRSVATKQAPGQLNAMAAKLGLVPAGSPAFLRINPDGSITVLGHPSPVVAPPVVRKLTPAQKAAAKAAKLAAAKAKAAKAKLAKAKAKAAKARLAAAKAAKAAKAKPTKAKSTSASAPSNQPTPTTSPSASRSPKTTPAPSSPAPTSTGPTSTAPKSTAPSPGPTVTISGAPR